METKLKYSDYRSFAEYKRAVKEANQKIEVCQALPQTFCLKKFANEKSALKYLHSLKVPAFMSIKGKEDVNNLLYENFIRQYA